MTAWASVPLCPVGALVGCAGGRTTHDCKDAGGRTTQETKSRKTESRKTEPSQKWPISLTTAWMQKVERSREPEPSQNTSHPTLDFSLKQQSVPL